MDRQTVESSQIQSIGYDETSRVLEIEFKPPKGYKSGSVYMYANVEPETHAGFFAKKPDGSSPSIGSYFGTKIKPNKERYPYVRVAEPVREE